jgi:chlorobactene glucosyltransferase
VLLEAYLFGTSLVCLYFLLLSLANRVALRRLNIPPVKIGSPKVSILVPARDEAHNIRACLDSLLNQDYGNYEIMVLDDHSSDGTAEILCAYEKAHSRVSAFTGAPLPAGWLGKHFACHQLSEKADGDYFLFTDADTIHGPRSVSWAMTNLLHHDADFLSAYPRQKIGSLGEATIVPGMYLITSLFLPVWLFLRSKRPFLSFALGQFVMLRSNVFRAVGGYEKIKGCLVDDISLVRNVKAGGFRTLFLDGKDFVTCRMYHGYREAFRGFAKSLYAALDKSLPRLLGTFVLIAAAIIAPLAILAFNLATEAAPSIRLLSALPVAIFFLMWFLSMMDRKLPLYVPFLYPFLFVNLLAIALVSAAKTGYGNGALWKRRLVK